MPNLERHNFVRRVLKLIFLTLTLEIINLTNLLLRITHTIESNRIVLSNNGTCCESSHRTFLSFFPFFMGTKKHILSNSSISSLDFIQLWPYNRVLLENKLIIRHIVVTTYFRDLNPGENARNTPSHIQSTPPTPTTAHTHSAVGLINVLNDMGGELHRIEG